MDDAWWQSMTSTDTPNAGRCWWGWGTVTELKKDVPFVPATKPLSVSQAATKLRPPRIPLTSLPEELQQICSDDVFERLLHSRGRDFLDLLECINGVPTDPTDLVAFPSTEAEISALFVYCNSHRVAVVPWGAGSSVVFGVNPPADSEGYRATITVDMIRFDKVLEIDEASMCARIQAGVYGPALERQLKAKGYTLRHYPQSFEFSTFGGWVVTRGAGHFATGPTHIDEMVQSVRVVAPSGIAETRQLPASGAGPAQHRLYVGSEGVLGIMTEGWIRILPIPKARGSATLLFRAANGDADDAFFLGARAVQKVIQAGLQPANLRLVYGLEVARLTQEQDLDDAAVLLLGFEAERASASLEAQMQEALEICLGAGGKVRGELSGKLIRESREGERDGTAGKWGTGFMRGGYMFSAGAMAGLMLNTFETATTWDRFFGGFHSDVMKTTRAAIREACGDGVVTCRLTHVYRDGPAPYYTVLGAGETKPVDRRAEQWMKIKNAAMAAVMRNGGTSSHHHAVGKLHVPYYDQETCDLVRDGLKALKASHDPHWILNPGVLFDGSQPAKSKL
eukprot:TRINITY_DN75408_c0_g1_i1.p1 TRINITY_DN75408_c0_g1~~TRINITY_DN75408_c0_g1_i1.p1  ORF type:complete len:587 (-),score=70.48 TRINITY_DN75408_c0_g1_i1:284-1981(-)